MRNLVSCESCGLWRASTWVAVGTEAGCGEAAMRAAVGADAGFGGVSRIFWAVLKPRLRVQLLKVLENTRSEAW